MTKVWYKQKLHSNCTKNIKNHWSGVSSIQSQTLPRRLSHIYAPVNYKNIENESLMNEICLIENILTRPGTLLKHTWTTFCAISPTTIVGLVERAPTHTTIAFFIHTSILPFTIITILPRKHASTGRTLSFRCSQFKVCFGVSRAGR